MQFNTSFSFHVFLIGYWMKSLSTQTAKTKRLQKLFLKKNVLGFPFFFSH